MDNEVDRFRRYISGIIMVDKLMTKKGVIYNKYKKILPKSLRTLFADPHQVWLTFWELFVAVLLLHNSLNHLFPALVFLIVVRLFRLFGPVNETAFATLV